MRGVLFLAVLLIIPIILAQPIHNVFNTTLGPNEKPAPKKINVSVNVSSPGINVVIANTNNTNASSREVHYNITVIKREMEKLRLARRVQINTSREFTRVYRHWLKIRAGYLNGTVDEAEYLNATKRMIISAIDAVLERLNVAISLGCNNSNLTDYVTKLKNYRKFVENCTNITELRSKYPEIRKTIKDANLEYKKCIIVKALNIYEKYLKIKEKNKKVLQVKIQKVEQLKKEAIQNITSAMEKIRKMIRRR